SPMTHYSSLPKFFPIKISQLHRRGRGFESLVPRLDSGAVHRLFDIVSRNDAKEQRHTSFQTCFAYAARGFGRDVIKVRGLSADNRAQTNYRVELSGFGGFWAHSGISNEPGTRKTLIASLSTLSS